MEIVLHRIAPRIKVTRYFKALSTMSDTQQALKVTITTIPAPLILQLFKVGAPWYPPYFLKNEKCYYSVVHDLPQYVHILNIMERFKE